MYKVIGSDNREYGPASEEVIRRWIAEGRANGATQVQKEGETSWRPLSSCVEFAGALAAGSLTPPVAVPEAPASAASASAAPSPDPRPTATPGFGPDPAAAAAAASALESELLARDANLDIGACVQRSWELFQKNPWLVAGAWAVAFFVAVGVGLIPYVGLPASIVLGGVLLAGIHVFFLRLSRGQVASVADVFAGFGPAIGPLILCGTVSWLLGWFGILLCVIPGIYLMLCWHLAPLLILDRNLEFWPAMEISRKVVTRNFWPVLGLAVVAFLLWIAGLLLCGIGIFVTGPIATGAAVEAYRRLFETGPSAPGTQSTVPVAQSPASVTEPSAPVAETSTQGTPPEGPPA